MCFYIFFIFFSSLNIQLKPDLCHSAKTSLFSISTVMMMLMMKDFINYYVFCLLQTPVYSVAEASHACFEVTSVLHWLISSLVRGEKIILDA